ncbi:MAG: putative toxin-antitoxin system toxin component, PIN family [Herpetosiphonaceae bacterium]|nr:putative toxin-antitoxin system toxin component, PIN family [Herpetosiphonaceae bacterium]
MRIALDTDAFIAATRSATGASREILLMIERGEIEAVMTVPMLIEYEAVLKRPAHLAAAHLTVEQADNIIKTLAGVLVRVAVRFSWRPQLADANDEMILEAAVNGHADAIVTFNTRHYTEAAPHFGVAVLKPGELLRSMQP